MAFWKALAFGFLVVFCHASGLVDHHHRHHDKAGVHALFVFGDSIVDPGNNNNLDTIAKANHLPYGFKFKGHEASGRFCDGKLAVDLVAEHLGLPYPPPYSPNSSAATQGMNFGSATSGILNSTGMRLYDLGARKFVVVGILNVGCVPATQLGDSCTELGEWMTKRFNEQLQTMLEEMRTSHQGFTPIYANAAGIMDEVMRDPAAFGMSNVHHGCCPSSSIIPFMFCYPGAFHCKDSSKYMFWDLVHPTEAFNTILVQRWYNGSTEYVSPMNIAALAAA
ncbi:GDSL esterase/lipase 7 [Selaginella moellendorffii]|uniref:GDSL esterase/lipase 7 n=1 Tax=Selaginella moellendorffii TaxID=88036 RepID=UPI000D1CB39F|nr:GDSL esterase/lipase 7 [Selaginella moellendorffii]|eukprot:XP_024537215.1 GDSL esterase/lipase 7 [Selaginella moellendorffii]